MPLTPDHAPARAAGAPPGLAMRDLAQIIAELRRGNLDYHLRQTRAPRAYRAEATVN